MPFGVMNTLLHMHRLPTCSSFNSVFTSVAAWLTSGAVVMVGNAAIAQSLPDCQPPGAGEYLLLVLNESAQTQNQLRQTLPSNAESMVCNYLGRSVTRVSGFTSPEVASSWAQYLSDIGGMQAFVARSAEGGPATTVPPGQSANPTLGAMTTSPTATEVVNPTTPAAPVISPAADSATVAYNPQPLGEGYAVLVDYFNKPDVAAALQQTLARSVGLVSYNNRPYLLAAYTTDAAAANTVLSQLNADDFTAVVVDSRGAVLISSAVAVP